MRVLQINKLYYPHVGGVEKHLRDLSIGLNQQVDLRVLVANESAKTVTEQVEGVRVTRVASLGRLLSAPLAPTFPRWLKRLPSDIYHCHFPNPIGELSYLKVRPMGKLVVTYHSDIVRQKFVLPLYGPAIRRFLAKADAILVGSPQMIEHSEFLQSVANKCRVVHFGIDTARFEATEDIERQAKALRQRYGQPLLFFLGRLIYYKGLEYLVRAMTDVDAKLLVAGEGPLRGALERLVGELGLSQKVLFLGQIKDSELPAHYHACDVFVLPSVATSEAFGLVQIEAHASGKPVVSTSLPTGVPYANLDGVTGLVVPPKDSVALAVAINSLLSNDDLRLKLGAAAKQRVEREFTVEGMIDNVMAVYESL